MPTENDKPSSLPLGKIIIGIIALVLGVGGIVYYLRTPNPTDGARRLVYAYDLSDGSLVTVPMGSVPPFEISNKKSPEGKPTGVLALVYACSDCKSPKDRFIGYLRTNSPELKAEIDKAGGGTGALPPGFDTQNAELIASGELVASADAKPIQWHAASSSHGASIIIDVSTKCPGATPIPCSP